MPKFAAQAGCGLCARDEIRIALVLALEGKKVVVAAVLRIRILTAHAWPRLVHRAAADDAGSVRYSMGAIGYSAFQLVRTLF